MIIMSSLMSGKRTFLIPYALILPAFALIIVFRIYPILSTLLESIYVNERFTFSVYVRVLKDQMFWNSLWVTVKLNLVMIPFQIFISFIMALLVNVSVRGIGVFRTLTYLPFTLSLAVATILWNIMLNPNNGVINSFLGVFDIPAQGFFISSTQALWSIMAVASWRGCAYWMMFILAGLKNIDPTIYESARIDGTNWFTSIIHITLPLLKRVILFVFVANTTSNFLLFVPMQMITGGGPQGSTNVLMYEAYKSAFRFADRPRSSVIVTVLLFMIVLICLLQFRLLNEKEDKVKGKKKGRKQNV